VCACECDGVRVRVCTYMHLCERERGVGYMCAGGPRNLEGMFLAFKFVMKINKNNDIWVTYRTIQKVFFMMLYIIYIYIKKKYGFE